MKAALTVSGTQLTQSDVDNIYRANVLIVNYNGVHQIFYSGAQKKFYWNTIIKIVGLTDKGRFHTMTPEEVKNLLNLLNIKKR